MDEIWPIAMQWMIRALAVGGLLTLVTWLALFRLRNVAIRHSLISGVIRASVLGAVLCAIPAWFVLPAPSWMKSPAKEVIPPVVTALPVTKQAKETFVYQYQPEDIWTPDQLVPTESGNVFISKPFESPTLVRTVANLPQPADVIKTPTIATPSAVATTTTWQRIGPMIVTIFAITALALMFQYAIGLWAIRRLARDAEQPPAYLHAIWNSLTSGMRHRPTLLITDRIHSAVCFGFFRPTVLIPKSLTQSADETELRWVLAHELDHIHRGDHRTLHWLAVARALFFAFPWFWSMRRSLMLSQEYLADAAASADGRRLDYAEFLVTLSDAPTERRWARPMLVATGVRAGKSDLFRRIHMLVNWKMLGEGRLARRWKTAIGMAVITGSVMLSGLGFARSNDEPPARNPFVKPAEKPAEPRRDDKPAEPRRDGDREAPVNIGDLKAKIEEAIKKGDAAEARKLLEQLDKALQGNRGREVRRDGDPRPAGPRDGDPKPMNRPRDGDPRPGDRPRDGDPRGQGDGRPGFAPMRADLRQQFERQMREFQEAIERVKDNAEAREQLEKARDEFKKAMEEGLKAADAVKDKMRDLKIPGLDMQIVPFPGGVFDPNLPFPGGDMIFGRGGMMFPGMMQNPRLGVQLERLSPVLIEQLGLSNKVGVVISQVRKDSAADKAGIKPNDILLELNGKEVNVDPQDLMMEVNKLKGGEKIDAVVLRKGKKETIKGIEISEIRRPMGGGFGANSNVKIQINNGEATIDATLDGVEYKIVGEFENNKIVPSKITIKDGDKKVEAESIDKVPEAYKANVERLIVPMGRR